MQLYEFLVWVECKLFEISLCVSSTCRLNHKGVGSACVAFEISVVHIYVHNNVSWEEQNMVMAVVVQN
jgi:hypothetical protein